MFGLRRPRRQETYPAGSCTRHVYDTVPWVPLGWGDAHQWPASAIHAGLRVDVEPKHGALAVWQPVGAHSPYGHVSLVVDTKPGGHFCTYEHGYDGNPGVTVKWWDTSQPVWFIHEPSAPQVELPRGPLHNGTGDSNDPIVQVAQSWNALTWYWDSVAFYQSLKIELLAMQINRM